MTKCFSPIMNDIVYTGKDGKVVFDLQVEFINIVILVHFLWTRAGLALQISRANQYMD